MPCTLRFEVLGLAYLLNTDVSMSLWFFPFLAILAKGSFLLLGVSIGPIEPFSDPAPPSVAHFALGALFVLVVGGFWRAREHLGQAFSRAFKGNRQVEDAHEAMSYRTAFGGIVVGGLFALVWLALSGLSVVYALVFLGTALIIFIGLTRIVSQTGMAYGRATVTAPVFIVDALGSTLLGARSMTALALTFAWATDLRTLVMTSTATGFKLADAAKIKKRPLMGAIFLAILVSLVASMVAILNLCYRYGGINLGVWHFSGLPKFAGDWSARHISNPVPTSWWHLGCEAIGAGAMVVLTFIKNRFVWWPIHPVGMAVGLTAPINRTWFSVFLAWLLKSTILRWGGAKVYVALRPFFLGIVLGMFCSAGMWLVIDAITGVGGNFFTVG